MENRFGQHIVRHKFGYGVGAILVVVALVVFNQMSARPSSDTGLEGNVKSLFSNVNVAQTGSVTSKSTVTVNNSTKGQVTVANGTTFTVAVDNKVTESVTVNLLSLKSTAVTSPITVAKGVTGSVTVNVTDQIPAGNYRVTVTGEKSGVSASSSVTVTKSVTGTASTSATSTGAVYVSTDTAVVVNGSVTNPVTVTSGQAMTVGISDKITESIRVALKPTAASKVTQTFTVYSGKAGNITFTTTSQMAGGEFTVTVAGQESGQTATSGVTVTVASNVKVTEGATTTTTTSTTTSPVSGVVYVTATDAVTVNDSVSAPITVTSGQTFTVSISDKATEFITVTLVPTTGSKVTKTFTVHKGYAGDVIVTATDEMVGGIYNAVVSGVISGISIKNTSPISVTSNATTGVQ